MMGGKSKINTPFKNAMCKKTGDKGKSAPKKGGYSKSMSK